MSNTSDNTEAYTCPPCSTSEGKTMEEFRRGLCKEIEATRQVLQGKQAQLKAVERSMGIEKKWNR